MPRALLVLLVASRAHAESTFAVDIRSSDVSSDKLAPALEEAVRVTKSRYVSQGTHADRVKAQVDTCDFRAAACALDIGKRLGVDYMLSGSIERHGAKLLLTLDVYDVARGKRVRSVRDQQPLNVAAKAWAKLVMTKVADQATANVVVRCNVHHAMVFVDGAQVTELYDGSATLASVGLGHHLIELEGRWLQAVSRRRRCRFGSDADRADGRAVNYFLGCPGWGDKRWVGRLFPPGTRSEQFLQRYAQVFNTVEGNTTFYALPTEELVAKWREAVPDSFRFCFKFPKTITHDHKLQQCDALVEEFLARLHPLRDVLGTLMVQLPPMFDASMLPVLAAFLDRLPALARAGGRVPARVADRVRGRVCVARGSRRRPRRDGHARHARVAEPRVRRRARAQARPAAGRARDRAATDRALRPRTSASPTAPPSSASGPR